MPQGSTGLAVAAMVLAVAAGVTSAQAPLGACALVSRAEFQALTGKPEYLDPEAMPWGTGSVCGFGSGQILLWTGADAATAFDRLSAGFGRQGLGRVPVEGLGAGAFAVLYDPEDRYQDAGAFVVFGAGPPTVAVTVYAEDGRAAETALPPAMAVAKAVAAKLD